MATIAQITANRLNSQSSAGPRTGSARHASSRNPVRHELALDWFRRERVRTMEAAFFSLMLEQSAANAPGLP
jgi:hypothetical protein